MKRPLPGLALRAALALVLVLVPLRASTLETSFAQTTVVQFPATGKQLKGKFLEYWNTHGGLPQQGYPISDEFPEVSTTDGKTYTVQYFERAVFELHPENAAPNDVLLSLLGVSSYKQRYPQGAPGQAPNTSPGSVAFEQTGHR
ncbi:MAG TPA: hypothetical protein VFH60_04005, partial [Chloroflexia bacterium]|nr:hypothetical protein [Chloroflexia bacterium]